MEAEKHIVLIRSSTHLFHPKYLKNAATVVCALRHWLLVAALKMYACMCACVKDSRWWLTIQCAASSFNCGTSNRAWLKSSSRAVGLVLGSLSRHFWINSYKNKHLGHTKKKKEKPSKLHSFTPLTVSYPLQWVLQ